jgi:replication factor C small subunit
MRNIGTSSLWEKRYEPTCLEDYICSPKLRTFAQNIIDSKEVPTMLLCGLQGTGKTSLARVISKELSMDLMYINGSLENGIDEVRYKVKQFASVGSMMGGKKLVIIDEADRLSGGAKVGALSNPAQDALKVLIEESEANARFILCTNNPRSIIPPLRSRCREIDFNTSIPKDLQVQYFKRLQFILTTEGVKFDKKVLVELTKKYFPDFRKLINEVQMCSQMFGEIDERVLAFTDTSKVVDLLSAMKEKSFPAIRQLCEEVDTSTFYRDFYDLLDTYVVDECKPSIILEIADFSWKDGLCLDKSINLTACIITIMKHIKWK